MEAERKSPLQRVQKGNLGGRSSSNALAAFTIPSRIGASESNALQQQIQNLVPTVFNEFYPEVIISYATGRRPGPTGDVEGAGPGLYKAADVIKALFNRI